MRKRKGDGKENHRPLYCMTLIITAVTPDKIIQASDRRLTYTDGGLCGDNANKAVCVGCKDAHFAIAYTGLAEIKGKRTDIWLIDYLASINASQMQVPAIVNAIEKQANDSLKAVPKEYKKMTFVLVGYRNRMPFIALISNFEDLKNKSGEAQDSFNTDVRQVRGLITNPQKGLWIYVNGCEQAVDKPIHRRIRKLHRKRFFHREQPEVIADTVVSLIRAASRTRPYGRFVGRDCMTVVLKASSEEGINTKYHPDKRSPVTYMPHLITGGLAHKGIEYWTEEPPWWKS